MSDGERISVMRVRGVLLVSVPPDPSDATISSMQGQILEAMEAHQARGLILDVGAVEILDSFFARTLAETAQMVSLMGGITVMSGMRPSVALAATELGLRMPDAHTALDLDRALEKFDA